MMKYIGLTSITTNTMTVFINLNWTCSSGQTENNKMTVFTTMIELVVWVVNDVRQEQTNKMKVFIN